MMKRAILILIAATFLALGQATFALDTCLPTLTMTPTALPAYVQANPSVSGTATDATTGISAVRGAIFYFDESGQAYFWDGSSSWVTSDYLTFSVPTTGSLNTPGAIVSWNYTFPTLTNDKTYYYVFLAKDQANNLSADQVRSTICDSSNPILGGQFPSTSGSNYTRFGSGKFYINNVQWDLMIRGMAVDTSGSGQIDRIELTISETGGYYFNGDTDSWQTAPCSFNALRGSASDFEYYYPLGYTSFSAKLHNGDLVTIEAKAYDKAGNYTTSTQLLKIDTVSPTVTVTTPDDMTTYPTEISGEATDASGVETVFLTIKRTAYLTSTVTYWNGLAWQATAPAPFKITDLPTSGSAQVWRFSTNILFKGTHPQDTFQISVTAIDRSGKLSGSASKTITAAPIPSDFFLGISNPPLAFNASHLPSCITAECVSIVSIPWSSSYFSISRYETTTDKWYWYKWATKTWALWAAPISDFAGGYTSASGNFVSRDLAGDLSQIYFNLQDGEPIVFGVKATDASSVNKTVFHWTIYDNTAPINPTPMYSGVKWSKEPVVKLLKSTDFNPATDPKPSDPARFASGIAAFSTRVVFNTATITSEVRFSSGPESLTVNLDQGAGIYSLYVNTLDLAGNFPATESCLQVGYDNLAPISGSITYPACLCEINTTTPTISWNSASDDHSGVMGYYILVDGRVIGGTAAGVTSFTVPYEQRLVNGSHSLKIRAIDKAGNYSDATASFTVNTLSAPQISISNPVNGQCLSATSAEVQGLVSDDCLINKVEMSINGGAFTTIFSGSLPKVGIYQIPALVPNASNTITIRATDDSCSTTEATVAIILDTQAPAAFNLLAPADGSWTLGQPSISWEKSSDAVSGFKGYDLYLDSVKVNTDLLNTESFNLAAPLANGPHTYYVVAWDLANNYYQTPTYTFNADSGAPIPPVLLTPLEGQIFTSAFNIAWQQGMDTDSGMNKYEVYLNDAKYTETSSSSLWVTKTLSDGAYAIKVVAYDKLGNSSTSNIINIAINVNAPTIALYVNDKSLANNAQINTLPKIRAEVQDTSGLDPSSIQIYIDDQLQSNLSLQTVSSQASQVTAYNVIKNDLRLEPGTHKLKIVAKDIYGKSTSRELIGLKVLGQAQISGFVMNYPNPFKPTSGTGTTINYTLVDDASLKIMIYDLSGRLINKLDCLEGTEGGRFGENNVPYGGKTFTGDILANGTYVYLIVDSKNNVIGSGEMAVYE